MDDLSKLEPEELDAMVCGMGIYGIYRVENLRRLKAYRALIASAEPCPACGGAGGTQREVIDGYVTHEMAIDGGDRSSEGQPVTRTVLDGCQLCQTRGAIIPFDAGLLASATPESEGK